MEGAMGATTERGDVLQPASGRVQLPSWPAPLHQPPPTAAEEEVARALPGRGRTARRRAAQQSSEAPLLEVPQATTPFAAAAKLEADEVSPTTTEWEGGKRSRNRNMRRAARMKGTRRTGGGRTESPIRFPHRSSPPNRPPIPSRCHLPTHAPRASR